MPRRFQFGPQPALDRARTRLDALRRALAESLRRRKSLARGHELMEEALAAAQTRTRAMLIQQSELEEAGMSAAGVRSMEAAVQIHEAECDAIKRRVMEAGRDLVWAGQRVQQARRLLSQAMRRVEALEKLRESRESEFRKNQRKMNERRTEDLLQLRSRSLD